VILKGDEARSVLDDARAFLGLERWYAERGIPYRRGYLLHGAPGSGKTSLVCAIAGELRLPIYQLRLTGAGLDDEAFQRLLAATSRRAVVLLEDVDAARGAAVGSRTGREPSTPGIPEEGEYRRRIRVAAHAPRASSTPSTASAPWTGGCCS
jgi:chaperone BCS1